MHEFDVSSAGKRREPAHASSHVLMHNVLIQLMIHDNNVLLVQPDAPPALGAAASGSLVAADFFGEHSCVSRLFSVVSNAFFLLFHGSHTMIDVFWGLMYTQNRCVQEP